MTLSIIKFLGFEQVFKNSLTTLPMGGGLPLTSGSSGSVCMGDSNCKGTQDWGYIGQNTCHSYSVIYESSDSDLTVECSQGRLRLLHKGQVKERSDQILPGESWQCQACMSLFSFVFKPLRPIQVPTICMLLCLTPPLANSPSICASPGASECFLLTT